MVKNKIVFLAAAMMLAASLSACGGNAAKDNEGNNASDNAENSQDNAGNTAEDSASGSESNAGGDKADYLYLSDINAADYVTLGEYKGIELTETLPSVSDEDVDQYIETRMLSSSATLVPVEDRTDVREGDTVNIDYAGYRDGVAFDGGTAQGQDLTIGSGAFIPGFEDGLIGSNVGDIVSLDLTFPENYGNAEMAGVSVTFEVTINKIFNLELPELTDEFVQEFTMGDCSTVEEIKSYIYDDIYASAESEYIRNLQSDISDAVMEKCTFSDDIPKMLLERYYDALIEDMEMASSYYGMDLTTYMKTYYNMDEETYTGRIRENVQTMAKQYIMFQAIADAEGLNLTDEEKSKAIEDWAAEYGYESAEALLEQVDERTVAEDIMVDKVIDFLLENAVINTN